MSGSTAPLYIVSPKADFPTVYGGDVYEHHGRPPAILVGDLALATVTAFALPHFDVRVCDEHVQPIDFDTDATIVALTGKINQRHRLAQVADTFRRRGKTVVVGGPHASEYPDELRPHCDVLVRGELEGIADELFSDLHAGRAREEYVGGWEDLARTPLPRWDRYPNHRASVGNVQTSRGCPFRCEFCDVIQYAGRKQRHKPIHRVMTELDQLYALGYRSVFLADDNFTVHRSRCKELLAALEDWNARQSDGKVSFKTQLSLDAGEDEELLRMLAGAGVVMAFIGIESISAESLEETHKVQNLRRPIQESVDRFLAHGISVDGGMMVGFDADGPEIFERQAAFAHDSGIPIFNLGALVALAQTPLFERLRRQGRLIDEDRVVSRQWETNIHPAKMSREALIEGTAWLFNELYAPRAFGHRVLQFLDKRGRGGVPWIDEGRQRRRLRAVEMDSLRLVERFRRLGSEEASVWGQIRGAMSAHPDATDAVLTSVIVYMQIRLMLERGGIWRHGGCDDQVDDAVSMRAPRSGVA